MTINNIDFVKELDLEPKDFEIKDASEKQRFEKLEVSVSEESSIIKIKEYDSQGNTIYDQIALDLEKKYYPLDGFYPLNKTIDYVLSCVREDEIITFSEQYPGNRNPNWIYVSNQDGKMYVDNQPFKASTHYVFTQVTNFHGKDYRNTVEIFIQRWMVKNWINWDAKINNVKCSECDIGYRKSKDEYECNNIFNVRLVEVSYVIIQITSVTISFGLIAFLMLNSISFVHMISYFENKVLQNVVLYLLVDEFPAIIENYKTSSVFYEVISFGCYSIYTHLYPLSNIIMFQLEVSIFDELWRFETFAQFVFVELALLICIILFMTSIFVKQQVSRSNGENDTWINLVLKNSYLAFWWLLSTSILVMYFGLNYLMSNLNQEQF